MKNTLGIRLAAFQPRALHALLAISVVTNILFALRLYFPSARENFLAAISSPPHVVSSDHVRGNPAAKATIVVYTDFECTFCARLHDTLRTVTAETDTRVIYRHFPLASHSHAVRAAEAAECAGAQGKFWEFSDALFAANFKMEGEVSLMQTALRLDLDTDQFSSCLSSGTFRERVVAQRAEGVNKAIRATPTFFVNGKRFAGALPIDQLIPAISKAAK